MENLNQVSTVALDSAKIESTMLQMSRDERKAGKIAKSIFNLARTAFKEGKNFHVIDRETLPLLAGNDYCLEQVCLKLQRKCDASELKVSFANNQIMFATHQSFMSYLNNQELTVKQLPVSVDSKPVNGTVKA